MNKKNILKIWFDKTFKKVVKVDNIDKIKQLMKGKIAFFHKSHKNEY